MRRNDKSPAASALPLVPATPAAVRAVDIDQPIDTIVLPASRGGQPYASLLVVPRLHGCPLGTLAIELSDATRVEGERLSSAI